MFFNWKIKHRPTVVAVGLCVSGTGFTRVFETLFACLGKHMDIHWLGIGYKGDIVVKEQYTLYPVNLEGGDIYGAYAAAALARSLHADNVLLLTDFYLLKNYERPLKTLQVNGVKLTAYVPIDGYFTNDALTGQCLFLNEMVLYNQWAMQEVNMAIENYAAAKKIGSTALPQLSYIYHGTDTGTFSAAATGKTKPQLKHKLFHVPDAANSIFILNANRYNERKDIASTITAFAKALPRSNKPAFLCLHTPNIGADLKNRLLEEINNSGCAENIILNPLGDSYCCNSQLNELYSACDIGINTSYGEGWGMISFEHAASGAAQLVPDHTAPGELWKDVGITVAAKEAVQLTTNPFLMYAVENDILADELVRLVNDDHHRDRTAAACLEHARKKMFSWQTIAGQWIEKLSPAVLQA